MSSFCIPSLISVARPTNVRETQMPLLLQTILFFSFLIDMCLPHSLHLTDWTYVCLQEYMSLPYYKHAFALCLPDAKHVFHHAFSFYLNLYILSFLLAFVGHRIAWHVRVLSFFFCLPETGYLTRHLRQPRKVTILFFIRHSSKVH
jgi:hypothetical protein